MILLKRAAGLGQAMKGLIPLKAPKPANGDGPSNRTKVLITSQLLVAAKSGHGDGSSNRTKALITSQLSLSRSDTGPDGRLRQP